MKSLIVLVAAATLSMPVFAGSMSNHEDMKEMHEKMHNEMNNNQVNKNILQNKELQRLHKEMTRYGMSEGGMEARVQMMSEEGRAYHRALKMKKMAQNQKSRK